MTSTDAPSSSACGGVTTRFWSPTSAPAGRTPGTTKKPSGHAARAQRLRRPSRRCRRARTSRASARQPLDLRRRANHRRRCRRRSSRSRLVSTVTATTFVLGGAAAFAAAIIAASPRGVNREDRRLELSERLRPPWRRCSGCRAASGRGRSAVSMLGDPKHALVGRWRRRIRGPASRPPAMPLTSRAIAAARWTSGVSMATKIGLIRPAPALRPARAFGGAAARSRSSASIRRRSVQIRARIDQPGRKEADEEERSAAGPAS